MTICYIMILLDDQVQGTRIYVEYISAFYNFTRLYFLLAHLNRVFDGADKLILIRWRQD